MAGFRPTNHLTGAQTPRTKLYPACVSAAMWMFDPVRVSSGVVKPLGTAVSGACLGSVAYFLDENKKPYTGKLPAGNLGKLAATTAFAAVYDDPDIIYEIECDVTASAGHIGNVCIASAGTPTTAAGISGYKLKPAAASAGDGQFSIISVRSDVSGSNAANNHAIVVIKRHTHRNAI